MLKMVSQCFSVMFLMSCTSSSTRCLHRLLRKWDWSFSRSLYEVTHTWKLLGSHHLCTLDNSGNVRIDNRKKGAHLITKDLNFLPTNLKAILGNYLMQKKYNSLTTGLDLQQVWYAKVQQTGLLWFIPISCICAAFGCRGTGVSSVQDTSVWTPFPSSAAYRSSPPPNVAPRYLQPPQDTRMCCILFLNLQKKP